MSTKVFIFVPAFGQIVTTATFLSSHALHGALTRKGIEASMGSLSFPDIAELRNMVFTIWHDTMPDTDYLLFIDADMAFAPDLVLDMILFGEPVVGTIYRQRKEPLGWAGSGTGGPVTERRGDFMLVEGVGFGCTLIHKNVARIMLEQMPELVDTRLHLHPAGDLLKSAGATRMIRAFEKMDIPERGMVSEDLSFCIRWNRCRMSDGTGGKVWAAIGHKMSHVGPYDYAGRYIDVVNEQQAQVAMMQQQLTKMQAALPLAGSPLAYPLSLPVIGAGPASIVVKPEPEPIGMAPPRPPQMAELSDQTLIESIENGVAEAAE